MIRTWTDSHGVKHYADEHSKAYRDRDEAKPTEGGAVEAKPDLAPAEESKPKPRSVTVKTDAQ